MPALRQSVKRGFWLILIAAVALAAAAIFDWNQPPRTQVSVHIFERGVVAPYRRFARPLVSRFVRCRYQPTCTAYVIEALHTHGFPKGLWLTTKRLCRCTPWAPFGTSDPVPARKAASDG